MTKVNLFGPQELYRHWEEGQWSPFESDLAADADQWRTISGEDRRLIFWVLSSLMVAEERITTKFSKTRWLPTRRRSVPMSSAPARRSPRPSARSSTSPWSRRTSSSSPTPAGTEAKVRFVTLYHQILEGTLGLTSFNFVTGLREL